MNGDLRTALEDAGAKVSVEAGDGLRASPPSVAALARAVVAVRERGLALRVCGSGDAPWGPPPGGVLLDLGALDRISSVDAATGIVRVEAGCSVAALESAARRAGSTLGPLLPSVRAGSVGAWLAGPTRGERGIPGARRETAALSVVAVLADGHLAESRAAPRSATGPDLDHLALGGEGQLCIVAAAWVRLFPAAPAPALCWRAKDPASAVRSAQGLCLERLAPARARVSLKAGGARVAAAWDGLSSGVPERERARRWLVENGFTIEADAAEPLEFARGQAAAHAVDVDASFAALLSLASSAGPELELHLVGLHAGGAFASVQLDGSGEECARAALDAGARVIAPRRLRDAGRGWEAMGAGEVWARLKAALHVSVPPGGAP